MTAPIRKTIPTSVPQLDWVITDDGSRTLCNRHLNETYHSGCGAVAESLVVYLKNSGVAARLANRQMTRVLEYGFGTGTSFLLTAALADGMRTPLEYWAIENQLLPAEILGQLGIVSCGQVDSPDFIKNFDCATDFSRALQSLHLRLVEWVAQTLEQCSSATTAPHFREQSLSEFVRLKLWLGDARDFPTRIAIADGFNAVYFDPFSPEKSPELWNTSLFQSIYEMLKPGGSLTSYCVKGEVRRMLSEVGFRIEKLPGPSQGKREVLVAHKC